jgi:serine/threonine protein kinase
MSTTLQPFQPHQFVAGQEIAPGYRIVEHLSRGNELDVYAAWSEERDCSCVVKLLRPDRLHHARSRERLLREGRLLTELCHPHLVRGYEMTDAQSGVGPVIVMETLTGVTLSWLIETEHSDGLDSADVGMLGLHLCSVLRYLHGRGVLHLDLKPSNIVAQAGKATLLDLSLAQAAGPCAAGMGTTEYMAPEQVAGDWVDTPADVWGLSGVLYRAATGRRPFPSSDQGRTVGDRVDLEPLRRPGQHPVLSELVAAGFAQEPHHRPTLADVRQGLLTALPEDMAPLLAQAN